MTSERRKRILVVVTLVCVGGWLADSLLIEPMFNAWAARSARIAELEQLTSESSNLLEREPDLRWRWRDMRKEALPEAVSEAERAVLGAVERWTSDSRLSLTANKLRWIDGEAGSRLIEVQVEGTGDMEALARFVYGLESDPLPLRIEELRVTAQDESASRLALSTRFTGLVLEKATS